MSLSVDTDFLIEFFKPGTSSVTPVPGPRSPTRQSVSALSRKINEGVIRCTAN